MADRTKKLSQKEPAQTATKPGQTKLDSFFVCPLISPATDSASHDSARIASSKKVEYFNNVGMKESLTCIFLPKKTALALLKRIISG